MRRIGYDGQEGGLPKDMTLAQIEPVLPPPGVAATMDPLPYCSQPVRDFLVHPETLLIDLPPEAPSSSKLWASEEEKQLIGDRLAELGMVTVLQNLDMVPRGLDGRPVRLGGFGVGKAKAQPVLIGGDPVEVLRMMVNRIPLNACLMPLLLDCLQLAGPSQLAGFCLLSRRGWLISIADRSCFFYLFSLNQPSVDSLD